MPGLADMLSARIGGQVYLLEPGATARGVLARCRDMRSESGGVSLVRSLPWDQAAITLPDESKADESGSPTHVLFGDAAYPLSQVPLILGTQSAGDERAIDLRQDMPGVSRRHCSLQLQNGQCVIEDYSRYGTFLNGHKIDGSALLAIGDQLRIGTPGFELRLITVEAGDGA